METENVGDFSWIMSIFGEFLWYFSWKKIDMQNEHVRLSSKISKQIKITDVIIC